MGASRARSRKEAAVAEPTLSLHHIIEQVSREKGIDPKVLVETMEQAILTAAKRTFDLQATGTTSSASRRPFFQGLTTRKVAFTTSKNFSVTLLRSVRIKTAFRSSFPQIS